MLENTKLKNSEYGYFSRSVLENADLKNSEYGYFSRSVILLITVCSYKYGQFGSFTLVKLFTFTIILEKAISKELDIGV